MRCPALRLTQQGGAFGLRNWDQAVARLGRPPSVVPLAREARNWKRSAAQSMASVLPWSPLQVVAMTASWPRPASPQRWASRRPTYGTKQRSTGQVPGTPKCRSPSTFRRHPRRSCIRLLHCSHIISSTTTPPRVLQVHRLSCYIPHWQRARGARVFF